MTDTVSAEGMYVEQREQLRQLQLVLSLSRRVAALDSLDEAIDTLLQAAIQEIGADQGSVFVHDDETARLLHRRDDGIPVVRLQTTQVYHFNADALLLSLFGGN